MSDKSSLYAVPIAQRPPRGLGAVVRAVAFTLFFLVFLSLINAFQFLLLPFAVLPLTRGLYADCIRGTKAAFAIFLVVSCQLFAPTYFRITYDTSNAEGHSWVQMDSGDPNATGLTLNWPKKVVMIANHQVYSDWWYLWALSYFANMHAHVLIVLKKSLKWVPIVGWGMQFFKFIFLARSWVADKDTLTSRLSALAAHHTTTTSSVRPEDDEPLNFMIFPEGTLISELTLPISKKYAEKMGYHHPTNTLLPRSTGLHTSLLALSPLPSLYLMDVTVAYPGIPRGGYGQSWYTLRSIFMDGIPPPEVVCHVRLFNVQRDVPLRANPSQQQDNGMTLEQRKEAAKATAKRPDLLEVSEEDKAVFDTWLRERWAEKDAWLDEWHARGGKGPLVLGSNIEEVVFPIRLKGLLGSVHG